ncbi:hypothetical protein NPIL_40201 [Nephila pilipes]|uniref:Uncharacterized protein n=1 Tax=Nephila pilipes TaxID=299642 RepID=A0A8X6Q1B8_NEPPI|nr:hypothetical protein NPIL_40201 [Nephila pilipes]
MTEFDCSITAGYVTSATHWATCNTGLGDTHSARRWRNGGGGNSYRRAVIKRELFSMLPNCASRPFCFSEWARGKFDALVTSLDREGTDEGGYCFCCRQVV